MIHYLHLREGEMVLKGRKQDFFWSKFRSHIGNLTDLIGPADTKFLVDQRRPLLYSSTGFSPKQIEQLAMVPGLYALEPAIQVENFEAITPMLIKQLELSGLPASFKVKTKRYVKDLPLNSHEIDREIGHQLLCHFGDRLKVDVHRPALTIKIKFSKMGILLSTQKILGPGGLPVGSSGHLLTLLSGGIDSPLASYLMATRGIRQSFIFFHAYPFVGEEVKEKVLQLATQVARWQNGCYLQIVPFGAIQKLITAEVPPHYRTLAFRIAMVQTAALLATTINAQGLIMGDALGQVASQTLGNLMLIDQHSPLTIFRPLLGLNKMDIMELARKIGTYTTSILPQEDACSLLAPRSPIINAKASPLAPLFDLQSPHPELSQLYKQALSTAEVLKFNPIGQHRVYSPAQN